MLDELRGQRVLLLQGPVGPFFHRLASELEAAGAIVSKVSFNAGDALFYRKQPAIFYNAALAEWPDFFARLLDEGPVSAVFLFGDRRPRHKAAIEVAKRKQVPVYVFEEGYLRPNHITIEEGGVNGCSPMSKDPAFYLDAKSDPASHQVAALPNAFLPFAFYSTLYALAHSMLWWTYPKYKHHRSLNVATEAVHWVRSSWRKIEYGAKERGTFERLCGPLVNAYFLVPLQVHLDAQIEHTQYRDVIEFVEEVITSFANHADPHLSLVIKHHPLDRGYRDYRQRITALGKALNVEERLIYIHDLHLPTLIKNARGVVMMNSTVGMSSLFHGTPVKLKGKAVYDLPGLTFQGSLEEFWQNPGAIDKALFQTVTDWMLKHNQPNGSFYLRLPGVDTPTGILWPEAAFFKKESVS